MGLLNGLESGQAVRRHWAWWVVGAGASNGTWFTGCFDFGQVLEAVTSFDPKFDQPDATYEFLGGVSSFCEQVAGLLCVATRSLLAWVCLQFCFLVGSKVIRFDEEKMGDRVGYYYPLSCKRKM